MVLLLSACGSTAPSSRAPVPATTASGVGGPELPASAAETGHAVPADEAIIAAEAGPLPAAGAGPAPATLLAVEPAAAQAIPEVRRGGTEVGYLLLDLESGQTYAELNPDLPLIPASTTKLSTALVALDVLGPEHRFRTELLATGPVRYGVLEGDLVLRGTGDPSLDVADLLELAVLLRSSGVFRVEGRFLIDDSALPLLREIDPTQPLEAAYNSGIGALSVAFNRVRLSWRGGRLRESQTLPPLAEARFEMVSPQRVPAAGVELARDGDQTVIWRLADTGRRQVRTLPVKDPGLHAGRIFHWFATAQGVALAEPERGLAPSLATVVAAHDSAPLRHLLRDMLVYSNNMMAETIGLAAASRLGPVTSLDEAGARLVVRLRQIAPEVEWQSAQLGNHSGLDARARLTPRQLVAILRHGWESGALPALLPAGGWSGTLARRFDEPEHVFRVWAKTGTLNYGSALAGYLMPEEGYPLIFATMVSDIEAREAYDRIERPTPRDESRASSWLGRATALQDELIERWLAPLASS